MKKKWMFNPHRESYALSRFIRIMKLTTFLLLFTFISVTASVYSQATKLDLKVQDRTVKDILSQIEDQSDFFFMYNDRKIDVMRKVNLDLRQAKIENILEKIFEGTDTKFIVKNRQIVIYNESIDEINSFNLVETFQQQQKSVSGKVTDSSGASLPGVSVVVKGTTTGTITDAKGNYSLPNVPENGSLQFSFVGMKTQEIPVSGKITINAMLTEETVGIEEVVAVGYGTMKKRDLTGAVSSVRASDLDISSDVSVGNALSGKIAGLQVRQISAQPGGGMSFQIRGATSMEAGSNPLFIVDGFPITGLNEAQSGTMGVTGVTSPLNFLNPNDIETIDVLKDASATAIYGARASNGVILITTKRGREGKPSIQFSSTYSVQNIAKSYDLLNASDYMKEYNSMSKENFMIANGVYPYGSANFDEAQANAQIPYSDKYSASQIANPPVNTNWIDLVTQQGMVKQNNLSVSGGSKSTRYSFSGNYYKNDGVVKNSGIERFGGRLNLDQDLGKNITTGINLIVSTQSIKNVRLGPETDRQAGVLGAAMVMSPLVIPIDKDGNYPLDPNFAFTPNPYSLLKRSDDSKKDELLANAFVEIKPIANLKLRANFGVNRGIAQRGTYSPKTTLEGSQNGGVASLSNLNMADYLSEFTANYNKILSEKHNINALVGYSYQKFTSNNFNASNSGYITDNFTYNALGIAENRAYVGSYREENKLVSFFGRVNYNFNNKYLLTATIRRDGATRFSDNNKWGTFPSIAVGWNMQDEVFFKPLNDLINNFKLRASYGQTGNSNIGSYAFGSYSLSPAFVFGSSIATGIFPSRLANPNLKWETTNEFNLGLDFGLWENRISGSLEYYNRIVSDLLRLNKPLQSYNEISTIAANAGKTQSKGFELSLTARVINQGDFRWTNTFTFSLYRDRWKERYDDWRPAVYENATDPMRAWYGYENDGILSIEEFQKSGAPSYYPALLPGMVKIKDINGYKLDAAGNPAVDTEGKFILSGAPDGKINDADRILKGTFDPGYLGGMSTTLSYKNLDINFNFYGLFDRSMVDPNFWGVTDMSANGTNTNIKNKERWRWDAPNTKYPGIAQATRAIYGYGDFMMQKAWFIRMRNLNVGYALPVAWTNKTISKCRIYIDIQNLFTITPYTGMDPEFDGASDSRLFIQGLSTANSAAYPNVRTFTLGLDINF